MRGVFAAHFILSPEIEMRVDALHSAGSRFEKPT
jgi:hypothetical protein